MTSGRTDAVAGVRPERLVPVHLNTSGNSRGILTALSSYRTPSMIGQPTRMPTVCYTTDDVPDGYNRRHQGIAIPDRESCSTPTCKRRPP